jgi:hexosaminidase
MTEGAFSPSMIYTQADILSLTEYAYARGVEIIFEIDVPGHAAGWTKGKPEIMADCFKKYYYNINDFALDPTLDLTYTTLEHVLGDIVSASGAHGSSRLHIGGDEVVTGCWANDSSIVDFMHKQGYTSYYQLLNYFVQRADGIVAGLNRTAIHWEEVFTDGCDVSHDNIFQVRAPCYITVYMPVTIARMMVAFCGIPFCLRPLLTS